MSVMKIILLVLVSALVVCSNPILRAEETCELAVRAPPPKPAPKPATKGPAKKPHKVVTVGPGGGYREQARKQNMAPGRKAPQRCSMKKVNECDAYCGGDVRAKSRKDGKMHSNACVKGWCKCDDPNINKAAAFWTNQFIDACKEIGNSKILKVVSEFYKGIVDAVQVASTIAGFIPGLGQAAKLALKGAVMAVSNTLGPGHIDEFAKNTILKVIV